MKEYKVLSQVNKFCRFYQPTIEIEQKQRKTKDEKGKRNKKKKGNKKKEGKGTNEYNIR